MTLTRRKVRTEFVQLRLDKRTKRMLVADASRRGTTMTALLLDAWRAYSQAAAELARAS